MISFEEDGYIVDKIEDEARWIATLSDGRVVYSDDGRPGLEFSSWSRLKKFCEEHSLYVKALTFQFRSHREQILSEDEDVDGLFLRRGLLAMMVSGKNFHSFIVGKIKDGQCNAVKWRTPELIVESEEMRDILPLVDSCIFKPGVLECLISQRDKNNISLQQQGIIAQQVNI